MRIMSLALSGILTLASAAALAQAPARGDYAFANSGHGSTGEAFDVGGILEDIFKILIPTDPCLRGYSASLPAI